MQNAAVTQEILKLEKKYWEAMSKDDVETMAALTDFPCIVAGAKGAHAVTEQEFRDMVESGQGKIKAYEIFDDSVEMREVTPEMAIIAYKVKSTFFHEGKDKTIEAVDTSTWLRRNGRWVCAMHTETELPKEAAEFKKTG